MRRIRTNIGSLTIIGGLIGSLNFVHAQTAVGDSFNGNITRVQSAQTDSIVGLVAEAQGLQLVPPAEVPLYGTFWTVLPGPAGGVIPPLPCPPLDPSLPIYAIADGQFLVGGTIDSQASLNTPPAGRLAASSTSAAALAAQANAVANLITQVQTTAANRQMRAMGMDVPLPGGNGSGDGGDGSLPMFSSSYTIDTNGLYLEITNVSNGLADLNLHNGTNQVYAIWSTTNLPANWNVEMEVWPTNPAVTPFTVATLERQNLFLRAEDWTGVTENGNTTPDWWLWKFFHTVDLSDSDLDANGNTLLYDYTNNIAPNDVDRSPILLSTISIPDPVDLKWDGTNLYVLSGSTATITEFATNGTAIRSLSGIGTSPSGFDVDVSGNVYVAVNGNNQVWKFNPTDTSFQEDDSFGYGGYIGNGDGSSGNYPGAFNAPFDVAVSSDGGTISVSDSGNNYIQQFDAYGHCHPVTANDAGCKC